MKIYSLKRLLSLIQTTGITLLLNTCGGANADPSRALAEAGKIWVAAWADAPESEGAPAGTERTLREIIEPSVGSRGTVRLHFSNYFGSGPTVLGVVHISP